VPLLTILPTPKKNFICFNIRKSLVCKHILNIGCIPHPIFDFDRLTIDIINDDFASQNPEI
jgi:hypothetical protein